MASINFVQYVTVIPTEWLNETNTLVHTIGGNATTDAEFRTNIGVEIGTDVQAYDAGLQSISGLVTAADKMVYTTALDVYATTDLTAFARTILDDANAAAVQATLSLVPGTNVQAWDADLDTIAALSSADSNFIVGSAGGWVVESGATARTSLGFTDGILDKASPGNIGASTPGTGAFTTLTVSDDITVDADASGTGSVFGGATGGAQGAGTINAKALYVEGVLASAYNPASVAITGGSITGITDLAVADGGTGASTAAGARTNLGLGTLATKNSGAEQYSIASSGSTSVANGASYVPTAGIMNFAVDAAAIFTYEIFVTAAWRISHVKTGDGNHITGGTTWSDGTNMRYTNGSGVAVTIYYQYKTTALSFT